MIIGNWRRKRVQEIGLSWVTIVRSIGKARQGKEGPSHKQWNIESHRRILSLWFFSWTYLNVDGFILSILLLSFSCSFFTQPFLVIHWYNPGLLCILEDPRRFPSFHCLLLELFLFLLSVPQPTVRCLLQGLLSWLSDPLSMVPL